MKGKALRVALVLAVLGALAAKCFGWPFTKHENNEGH